MYLFVIIGQHVQYFTGLCVRLMDLLYLCYIGYNIRQNNKWSIQLNFLIKQCKILMMFECHDSLDTLLIDFLEQITKNRLQSQPSDNKTPPLLTSRFLEKLHTICQKHQLSYLDDWVVKHKQLMKMHWEEKHRKTVHQRKQKKNQAVHRRRTVVIVPPNRENKEIKANYIDKRDRKSVKPNQRYENKFCSARKQSFNERLSIYKNEKQRRKSQNCRRRTIHQQKFKYTTKNYNQQIIYTFIDQDQPLNTNTQTLIKEPTTSQQQPEHQIKQNNPTKFPHKNK